MLPLIAVVAALLAGLAGWWFLVGSKQQDKVAGGADAAGAPHKEEGGKKKKKGAAEPKPGLPPKKEKKDDKKEAKHPQQVCMFKGHSSDILQLRFSGTCKVAGTVAEDRRLIVWDLKSLPPAQLMNLPLELDHGVGCAFSPDDKFVAVAMGRSREVRIYKTKGAKEGIQMQFKTNHSHDILSLDWSFDGKFLVTFSDDPKDTIRIFKPTGESLGHINPGALVVYSCAVSPDSRFVSCATMQCDARIWEVGTGKDGYKLQGKAMELTGRSGGGGATGHQAAVHCVDFGGSSPGVLNAVSKDAVTVSKDGTCKVWNIDVRYKFNEDPKCTLTFPSPDGQPLSLASLSKGGASKYVATWSHTSGLCFWSLPNGDLVSAIPTSECGSLRHIAFTPGPVAGHECLLATVAADGRARLWLPEPPK